MTDTRRYPNTAAAFEAGKRVGAKEERERLASEQPTHDEHDGPPALTLDAIRAGAFSNEELIERKDEVDRLLVRDGR